MTGDRPDMAEDTLDMKVKQDALRSLDMTEDRQDMAEDTLDMTADTLGTTVKRESPRYT